MTADTFFRLMYGSLVAIVLAIRLYGHLKADTFEEAVQRRSYDEGWITRAMRPLPIFLLIGSVLYVFTPDLMAWSTLSFPDWLRAVGIALGVLSIIGMIWVHNTLSKNFSGQLEIREDHTLVTIGPYRWVRHPMYTAVIALFIAIFLLTANWFIGLGGLAMVLAVIITRTPKEEAMLLETFGEDYDNYMRSTSRYLPWVY